ncbi:MAG: VanZ family protein [Proteobacteria bacterium]|nr:VanZ family protein [Pseudomonadota bacterium]
MNKPIFHLSILLLLYSLFLLYGALYPFHGWCLPQANVIKIVFIGWLEYIFLFDIVQNLLLFLPFGLFASGYLLLKQTSKKRTLLLATVASFCMSFFIESLQTYNPARIPSLLDVALNTISGFFGALIAVPIMPHYPKLERMIKNSLYFGSKENLWPLLGITVWLSWGFYQLFPLTPTLHPTQLLDTFMPLYLFMKRELPFIPMRFSHYALQALMLYFSGKLFITPARFMPLLTGFISLIFIGKIAIVGRYISIEMLLGPITVISILAFAQRLYMAFSLNEIDEPVRS